MPISFEKMLTPVASLVGRKGRGRKGGAALAGSLGELAKMVASRRRRGRGATKSATKRVTKGKTGKISKPKTTRTRRRGRGTKLQTRALAGLLGGFI